MQIGEDVIGFYKKPSASANAMEITIVEIPDAYETDTERVKLRDSFKYATVQYAVGEYWASRGDATEARKHGALYLEALGIREDYMMSREKTPTFSTDKEPWPTVTA